MVKAAGLVTRPLISRSRREKLGRPMSGLPSWLLLPANPPDIQFSFGTNQVFRKGVGLSSAASALVCVRPNPTLFAYAPDSSGNWLPFAPNVPRITDLGLLVEEGRANSIRNNSMQGVSGGLAIVLADGVEKLANGTFAGGSGTTTAGVGNAVCSGWTVNTTSGTSSITFPGTTAQITGDGSTSNTYVAQQISGLTSGRNYTIAIAGVGTAITAKAGTSANDTTFGSAIIAGNGSASTSSDRLGFTAPANGIVWVTLGRQGNTQVTINSVSVQDGERCQNGGFTSNPLNAAQLTVQNGWQWATAGSSVVTYASNQVTITGDGTNTPKLAAAIPTVNGFTYTLTVDIGTSNISVGAGTTAFGTTLLGVTGTVGTAKKFQFTAGAGTTTFINFQQFGPQTTTIANVSVQSAGALPANWRYVTTPTSLGLLSNVVGVATENGVDCVDVQLVGTPTSTQTCPLYFETANQVAATYGQTWAASMFAKLQAGSLANLVVGHRQNIRDAGLVSTADLATTVFTPTGTLTRYSVTQTLFTSTDASFDYGFHIGVTSGQAVNATFRLGWPQLENTNVNSTVASAAINNPGSGGVAGPSAAVYQIGGGTLAGGQSAATLNVTVTGGVISAINSVATPGGYSAFPPQGATLTYVSGPGSGVVGATVNPSPNNNASITNATSPIRTINSTVSRTGETITVTSPPSIGSAASMFVQATPMNPIPGYQNQYMMEYDDGEDINERMVIFRNTAGSTNFRYSHLGSNVFGSGAVFPSNQNTQLRAAEAGTSGDYVSYLNGSQIGVSGTAGFPSGLTTLRFGSNPTGFQILNGFISQAALWANQRISNANLQAITLLPTPAADLDLDFTANTLMLSGVAGGSAASRLACVRAAPPAYVSDSSGNWASVAANTPRMSDLGLLVEESRTNIAIRSQDLTGAPWATTNTTVAFGQASPDGGSTAVLMTDNAVNSQHALTCNGIAVTGGATYSWSVYIKAGSGPDGVNNFELMLPNSSFANNLRADFNIVAGTVSGQATSGTAVLAAAYIIKYPNGWSKCTIVGNLDPADTQAKPTVYMKNGNAYVGSGSTVYLWQAQLELGAYSTSPIVTTGSTQTRAADVVTLTSPPIIGSSYTMFAKGTQQAPTNYATTTYLFNLSDGTATNMATIFRTGGSQVAAGNLTGGSGGSVNSGNFVQNVSAKTAFAVTAAYQGFSLNGAVVTGAIATLPTGIAQVTFGNRNIDAARAWNGFVERAQLWPTTLLSPANLISITS